MLRNTIKSFGSLTKLLHWIIFILIAAQFYFIWYLNKLPTGSSERGMYMMLHKSVGMTVLILGLLFIMWHVINIKPIPSESQPSWQSLIAKIVHYALFILLIIMPLVGYLLSCANGKPINFYNLVTISCLIPKNEPFSDLLFLTHQKLAYLILILVGIHILAALYHHFILKDRILKRMLPFGD